MYVAYRGFVKVGLFPVEALAVQNPPRSVYLGIFYLRNMGLFHIGEVALLR